MQSFQHNLKITRQFISSTLVIGLGNLYRQDDAIGIHCAKKLKREIPELRVHHEADEIIDEFILNALEDDSIQSVVFIDACDFGALPGTLRILQGPEQAISSLSSHKFPLATYMEVLGKRGIKSIFVGIQVEEVNFTQGLTESLQEFLRHSCSGLVKKIQSALVL